MVLVFITGQVGAGKTLLLTILATESKREKICNYQVPGATKFELPKLLQGEYNQADIFLDEAYLYLESRTSTKSLNRVMSYVLFQSRKKGLNIFLTAQLASTIDLRFRKLADVVVICENHISFFAFHCYTIGGYRKRLLPIGRAEPYFQQFDTLEQIQPVEVLPEAMRMSIGPEDMETEAAKILAAIHEKFPDLRVTNDVVDYYFELHNLPTFLKKLVRVQSKLEKKENAED